MDLSICIVNWNTEKLLRQCLSSIYKKTHGVSFEIIVVDNASQDGSVEMLKKEFPQCKIILSNHNLGFSKANNLAIKQARGKYILFLNPDTKLKTQAITSMIRFLEENPSYGAVGCKLLNKDDSIQFTCARKFPTPFNQFCFLALLDRVFPSSKFFSSPEIKYWDHLKSRDVDCLSGACIMTRKEIIDRLGGFNENYFMYAEDIELCYRIQKNAWRIYYLGQEEIFHFSGSSSNQRGEDFFSAIMQQDSNYKFMKDNYGTSQATEFRILVFIGSIIRLVLVGLLLPTSLIYKKYQKEISVYSFKKYFNLLLWTITVKPPELRKEGLH